VIHVYLDDMRPCPKGFTLARNMEECIMLLQEYEVAVLSLDHDLGWNEKNGYEVVSWMVQHQRYAQEIYLHSSSLPARKLMYEILYFAVPKEVYLYQIPVPEERLRQIAKEKDI
jgi:hypothetical protein